MSDPQNPPRRHPRFEVRVPARISTIDPETDPRSGRHYFRTSQELCTSVSRGGVFIRTADAALEPGRRLIVELHLPDGRPFEAIGRVAWATKRLDPNDRRGVGVQFVATDPEQLSALERCVADAPTQSPAPAVAPTRPRPE
jgi:uncharacterized protein (TIGR02266 family)